MLVQGSVDYKTMNDAIQLTKFFAGQAIKAISLYNSKEEALTEYQKRLIFTLKKIEKEVHNGGIVFSLIKEMFNNGLPAALQHSSEKLARLLKSIGLQTKKGAHNIHIWCGNRTK